MEQKRNVGGKISKKKKDVDVCFNKGVSGHNKKIHVIINDILIPLCDEDLPILTRFNIDPWSYTKNGIHKTIINAPYLLKKENESRVKIARIFDEIFVLYDGKN